MGVGTSGGVGVNICCTNCPICTNEAWPLWSIVSFDSSCYYWCSVTKCCYTCEFAVSRVFHFRFVSVVPNVAYCWAWFALAQIRCVCVALWLLGCVFVVAQVCCA